MRRLAVAACAFLLLQSTNTPAKERLPVFRAGESYSAVRKALYAAGWRAVPVDRSTLVRKAKPYGYDEMVCGEGHQAVCSANFAKAGQVICVLLTPRESTATYVSTGPEC